MDWVGSQFSDLIMKTLGLRTIAVLHVRNCLMLYTEGIV